MRLKLAQLPRALDQTLTSIYLITGDEPLQCGEAADYIRFSAKKRGYEQREIFTVEGNFDWNQIRITNQNTSLFAEKKIIDLRLPSGKFGTEGAKILFEYCQHPINETLLLVSTGKLTSTQLKSRWAKAIDSSGVIIQIWALKEKELIPWLVQRLLKRGLHLEPKALRILALRVEGNLFFAAQEIEKLYILYGAGVITAQQVETVIVDGTRFNVFNLTDAVISGRVNRAIKILQGLQAEDMVATVILWALTRELRCLLALKLTTNPEHVFTKYQVGPSRQACMTQACNRLTLKKLHTAICLSATADRQIKGQQSGNGWETLLEICLQLCSTQMI